MRERRAVGARRQPLQDPYALRRDAEGCWHARSLRVGPNADGFRSRHPGEPTICAVRGREARVGSPSKLHTGVATPHYY